MSTVIERCEALSARMETLQRLEALQGQAEQLEEQRKTLEERRIRLAISVGRAAVLADHGHLETSSWPDVTKAKDALSRVLEKLRSEPTQLTSKRDYKNLLERMDRAAQSLEEAVTAAWSEVRIANDPVDEQLLERLAQVPGQADAVGTVRSLRDHYHTLSANPPATLDNYDAFMSAAAALAEAWHALDHGELPESVVCFFKAAQSPKGAPESLWTAEVRSWLDEHNMLNSVRIHFRGGR